MLRFEHLRDDFDRLMALFGLDARLGDAKRISHHAPTRLDARALSAEAVRLVRDAYREDYCRLGYQHLAPGLSCARWGEPRAGFGTADLADWTPPATRSAGSIARARGV